MKTPKEMTDKELCKEFVEIDKWIDNDEHSHSYMNEYAWHSQLSKEMTRRGFEEEDTYVYLDKHGKKIKY